MIKQLLFTAEDAESAEKNYGFFSAYSATSAVKKFVCIFLLTLFGCDSAPVWPPQPAEVHLGEDACAACKMIITDERFGAQLAEPNQAVRLFDDYGCLLNFQNRHDSVQRFVYVRSFQDGVWLSQDRSFYVASKRISSPMGYGIAAFPTREAAAEFARQLPDSKIYSNSELISAAKNILFAGSQQKE